MSQSRQRLTSPPPSWSPAPCSWLKMSGALYSFHTWQPAQSLQGSRKTTSPALHSSRPTTRPARNTRSRSLPRLKGKYFLCHLIWMITHQIIINEDIRVWIMLEPSCQWKTQICKCSDFRFHPKVYPFKYNIRTWRQLDDVIIVQLVHIHTSMDAGLEAGLCVLQWTMQ